MSLSTSLSGGLVLPGVRGDPGVDTEGECPGLGEPTPADPMEEALRRAGLDEGVRMLEEWRKGGAIGDILRTPRLTSRSWKV